MHDPISPTPRRGGVRRAARLAPIALALTVLGATACQGVPGAPGTGPSLAPTPIDFKNLPPPARVIATVPANLPSAPAVGTSVAISAPLPPPADPSRAEPRVGFMAPDFELEKLDGSGPVKLSELRGKPIFINFWATWCGPCKVEMPDIEQVHQSYKDQGLVVLGVDVQEPAPKVQDFVKAGSFSWQFILDKNSETLRQYRVTGLPSSFFVDKDGVIRDIVIGYTSRAVMEAKLKPLIERPN